MLLNDLLFFSVWYYGTKSNKNQQYEALYRAATGYIQWRASLGAIASLESSANILHR